MREGLLAASTAVGLEVMVKLMAAEAVGRKDRGLRPCYHD